MLEDGIGVEFQMAGEHYGFQVGDYWLIPARTIPGDIEWPQAGGKGVAEQPHGVERHFAPLAVIVGGKVMEDERMKFEALAKTVE